MQNSRNKVYQSVDNKKKDSGMCIPESIQNSEYYHLEYCAGIMGGCSRRNLNAGIYNLHWRYQFILFLLYMLPQSQVIFHRITWLFFISNSLPYKQSCWLCFKVLNMTKWCSVSDSIAPQNLLLVLLHLLRVHRAIHHPLLYAHLLLHAQDISKQRPTCKTSRIPAKMQTHTQD